MLINSRHHAKSKQLPLDVVEAVGKRSAEWAPTGNSEKQDEALMLVNNQLLDYTFTHNIHC